MGRLVRINGVTQYPQYFRKCLEIGPEFSS
jgi:hypothetical protein